MMNRIWGAVTSVIGGLILVLLVVFGTAYGTWVDEAGQLPIAPPSLELLRLVGALGLLLLVGGLIVVLRTPPRDRP